MAVSTSLSGEANILVVADSGWWRNPPARCSLADRIARGSCSLCAVDRALSLGSRIGATVSEIFPLSKVLPVRLMLEHYIELNRDRCLKSPCVSERLFYPTAWRCRPEDSGQGGPPKHRTQDTVSKAKIGGRGFWSRAESVLFDLNAAETTIRRLRMEELYCSLNSLP